MTVRSTACSLVIVALSLASIGGECTLGMQSNQRECFTGLGASGKIQVVLGSQTADIYGRTGRSCAGIDGLLPDTKVTLRLSKDAPRPNCGAGGPTCVGYTTTSVEGLAGVSVVGSGNDSLNDCNSFAHVDLLAAHFVGPTVPDGKWGSWEMVLRPELPPDRTIISPFDAGSAQVWIMWRRISGVNPPPDAGTGSGASNYCEDTFLVESMTNVTL